MGKNAKREGVETWGEDVKGEHGVREKRNVRTENVVSSYRDEKRHEIIYTG